MAMYRVGNGKKVVPHAPKSKLEVQYPLTWFLANPNSKPKVNITLVCGSLESARKAMLKSIMDFSIPIDLAVTFLYFYLGTIQKKCDEKWTSYGVTISEAGGMISPLSLLDIASNTVTKEIKGSDAATEKDDAWMAVYIAGVYRAIKAKQAEYKGKITKRINEQIKALHKDGVELTEGTDVYISWGNCKEYNALIGATDMFFNKFPSEDLSVIRVGTTGSRFKDCAALMSYGYLLNHLGMPKLTDLMDWVFIIQIGDDIERMMVETEELDDPYSYFPYQVDLGLVSKSAFSASSNPHFFEFVHLTGALLRSVRSQNARHICESQSMNILMNAACLAFTYAKTFDLMKVYSSTADEARKSEEPGQKGGNNEGPDLGDAAVDIVNNTLKSRDPTEWIKMLQATDNQMPEQVRDFVLNVSRNIKDIREGTIDEHLASLANVL